MVERAGVGIAGVLSVETGTVNAAKQLLAQQMYDRYVDGATLQEVGEEFGVSGERVRQILKEGGYSTAAVRTARRKAKRLAREAGIVERLLETRNIQAVAREFNVRVGTVKSLATAFVPDAQEEVRPGRRVPDGYWTEERIVDAIRRWAEEYGAPPHATDWNIAACRAKGYTEREQRFVSGLWPGINTVLCKFGSWNGAIKEAGFDPTLVGGHGIQELE